MMRYFLLVAVLLGLNSCNTCIGIGRDCKQAFYWTKAKIQNSGQPKSTGHSTQHQGGAPVY